MIRWAQVFLGTNTPVLEETRNTHREIDKNIMDTIMNDDNTTPQNRHIINRYRIHMQHTYLSEITSSDGTQMIQQMFKQTPPEDPEHRSEYDWLKQNKLNAMSWKKYTDTLKRIFCEQNGKLYTPLGKLERLSKK